MIAIDTNILVRFLTRDDPAQGLMADQAMDADEVWLSPIVIVETASVPERVYSFEKSRILDALWEVVMADGVRMTDALRVEQALSAARAGLDLDDALIWADTPPDIDLYAFDKAFVSKARRYLGAPKVVLAT